METIRRALSNRNIFLLAVTFLTLGIILIVFIFNLFTNSIQEREHIWETTLKFTVDNEKEFPYAVTTQQGNLYATGPLYSDSPLVTNENINGEYLAIREYREEYRLHTETYSCNCRTVNNVTQCSTCTRTYWSWDYDGVNYQKVPTIKLLSQSMDASLFDWSGGFLINNYHHVDTKEGKYHLYLDSHHRVSYTVISPGIEVSQGFRSDEEGLKTIEVTPDSAKDLKIARLALTIFLSILLISGIACWLYFGYENIDTYVK